MTVNFQPDEDFARHLDATDPLARFRDHFHLPRLPDGRPMVYLCGHSLGLQPKAARGHVERELDDWARLGVEGHFKLESPWYSYHELVRDALARLVGADPDEVVAMNSLTVNLHLMLATFYRPTKERYKILIDEPAFPSDLYAVRSQIRHHGFDPTWGLVTVGPPPGEHTIRMEDVEEVLRERGPEIAVVLWNGVNYFTGQFFDLGRLTEAAHRAGCVVGLDLAHAAGNVPLRLHDWGVDFAVWCHYKYVNAGPGAVGGCCVHERHGRNRELPRLAGWWGNDPKTRFRMHLEPEFIPVDGADGWQVSNPPILSLAPLRASLTLFEEAGIEALRTKSQLLTGYLEYLLGRLPAGRFEVISPRDPACRGCQLSVLVHDRPRELLEALRREGIVCDFREPNVIRVAPVPLYNTCQDVWTFAHVLTQQGEG